MLSNCRLVMALLCFVWPGMLLADFLDSYNTTAGTVGGQLSVSSTGSASYSIPIALPAGAGGVRPEVSLAYNSQAAQGAAGIGWSLGASGAITKCPSTIAQDGVIDPVDFDSLDRFCLGGSRLVPVVGQDGQPGTEYRTEIESFSKIESFGSHPTAPSYFRVWTKSGDILTYGGSQNGANFPSNWTQWHLSRREDRYGNYISYHYIQRESDFRDPDSDDNEGHRYLELTRIDYGQHANSSPGQPTYRVLFDYEQTLHKQLFFQAGQALPQQTRLGSIEIYRVGGSSGTQLVRRYGLQYAVLPPFSQSFLTGVQECDGSANCYPATQFGWHSDFSVDVSQKAGLSTYVGSTRENADIDFGRMKTGDFNGDGFTDIYRVQGFGGVQTDTIYLNDGQGNFSSSRTIPGLNTPVSGHDDRRRAQYDVDAVLVQDLNADGYDDIYLVRRGFPATDYVFLNNAGNGWSSRIDGARTSINPSDYSYSLSDLGRIRWGEFNGDGYPDIYYISGSGQTAAASIYLGNGDGTFQSGITGPSMYVGGGLDHSAVDIARVKLVDMNADGLTDVYRVEGYNNTRNDRIMLNDGAGGWVAGPPGPFTYVKGNIDDAKNDIARIRLADFNGDGATDVYQIIGNGNKTKDKIWLNNGLGGFRSDEFLDGVATFVSDGRLTNALNIPIYNYKLVRASINDIRVLDYNGDGITDVYLMRGSSEGAQADLVYLHDGAGRWIQVNGPVTYLHSNLDRRELDRGRILHADLNGDGKLDLYSIEGSGQTVQDKVFIQNGSRMHVVDTITTGLSEVSKIEYKPLNDASVYTRGCTASSREDTFNVVSSMHVVSSHYAVADANQRLNETTYQYAGLCAQRYGRGSVGFEQVTATNAATGIREVETFHQVFPLIGRRKSNRQELTNGDPIMVEESTWQSFPFTVSGKTRYSINLHESVTSNYELGSPFSPYKAVKTTVNWGNTTARLYGQPTSSRVDYFTGAASGSSGDYDSTSYSYFGVGTDWKLGRIRSTTTTKSSNGYSNSRSSEFTYTAAGAIKTEVVEPGQPYALTKTYEHDVFGNTTKTTLSTAGESPRVNTATWTADGRFIDFETNAAGHVTRYAYDDVTGHRTRATDPNGLMTRWTTDGFDRVTRVVNPDGSTTGNIWGYCGSGWSCSGTPGARFWHRTFSTINNGAGNTIVANAYKEYDRHERLIATKVRGHNGKYVVTNTGYDLANRVTSASVPRFTNEQREFGSTTAYDAFGRVKQTTAHADDSYSLAITKHEYNGLKASVRDDRGNYKHMYSNARGEVIKGEDAAGGYIEHTRDGYGNIRITRDMDGNEWVFDYDKRGLRTGMDDPSMGNWSYTYNGYGELKTQTDAKNHTTTLRYDQLGRKTHKLVAGYNARWHYDEDKLGTLSRENTSGYSATFAYDDLTRPSQTTKVIHGQTFTTSNTYDVGGRPKTLVYPTGYTVTYNYNSTYGYLASVQDSDGANLWTLHEADALGNPYDVNLGPIEHYRHFDQATNRVRTIMSGSTGGNEIQSLEYTWDGVGNLTSRTDHNQGSLQESFLYDGLDRLYQADLSNVVGAPGNHRNLDIDYSGMGNIDYKQGVGSYSYGGSGGPFAVNSISGNRSANYHYDPNGSMTSGAGLIVNWWNFRKPKWLLREKALRRGPGDPGPTLPRTCSYGSPKRNLANDTMYVPPSDSDGCITVSWGDATLQTGVLPYKFVLERSRRSDFSSGVITEEFSSSKRSTRVDLAVGGRWYFKLRAVSTAPPQGAAAADSGFAETSSAGQSNGDCPQFADHDINDSLCDILPEQEPNPGVPLPKPVGSILDVVSDPGTTDLVEYGGDQQTNAARGKAQSIDSDQDGVSDASDSCPSTPSGMLVDGAGCTKYGTWKSSFTYDANYNRMRQVQENDPEGDGSKTNDTTYYWGGLYERVTKGGQTTNVFYIRVGGELIATRKKTSSTNKLHYLLSDHQGSVDTVVEVNASGGIVHTENMSYDAFGKRRGTANWLDDPSDIQFNTSRATTRGYTGHEMLDGLNLIHMNGRIYDPIIGRFLSADPLVQAPENTQSYNRYAYVWNNPLKYTDPSGYGVFDSIKKELSRWESDFRHEIRRDGSLLGPILQVAVYAVSAFCGPGYAGCVAAGTDILARAQGASSSEAIKAAGVAAATAGIGQVPQLSLAQTIAINGVIAGTYAQSQGGNFASAFAASVVGASAGLGTTGDFSTGNLLLSALVGGAVSEATGGKFVNGAVTAAFSYAVSYAPNKSLHGGATSTGGEVTASQAEQVLEKLRGYAEFAAMEAEAGTFNLEITNSRNSGYDPRSNTIYFNPGDLKRQYRTIISNEYLGKISSLGDTAYYNALDAYPKWFNFSAERILFHEASHSLQDPSGLKYTLNRAAFENPVIDQTNRFMAKHFGEPYRRSYNEIR